MRRQPLPRAAHTEAGRNLTDKACFNGKLSLVGFFGREQGNVAAPRELGVTVKRSF